MSKADIDDVAMFTARAFAPDNVEAVWNQLRMAYQACPFMPPELCWALEEDGRVVFQWQLLDYTLRIGRATVRAAGCFGIASAEDARGRHHMLTVAQMGRPIPATEGFDILLGFAKDSRAFLQMDGTVPFGPEYRWNMPLPTCEAPAEAAAGFRPATGDDAAIGRVCAWHNAARTGLCNIVRTPDMWPWMLRKPPELFVSENGYIGVRENRDALEVREAAGDNPVFYARALAFACALAKERGLKRLTGHLPPEHPLVRQSCMSGAQIAADYSTASGSFAGLMRPREFMDKMHDELQHRWTTRFPAHRLELHISTFEREALQIVQVHNPQGVKAAALQLDITPGRLLQLCLGYAPARAIIRHDPAHAKAWVSCGDLPVDAVLDAMFPVQTPFIVHADRY